VIGDALALGALAGVVAMVVSGVVRAVSSAGRGVGLGPAALDGALVGAVVVVVMGTLSPLDALGDQRAFWRGVNLVPFDALRGAPARYAVINLLLLVPLVVLVAQRWRRAGVLRLTLLGAAVSVAVEVAQLFHPGRGTDVDDVLLNTLVAAAAAILGVAIRVGRRSHRRGTQVPRRGPLEAEVAAPAAAAAWPPPPPPGGLPGSQAPASSPARRR
jgi:hypothetical protein